MKVNKSTLIDLSSLRTHQGQLLPAQKPALVLVLEHWTSSPAFTGGWKVHESSDARAVHMYVDLEKAFKHVPDGIILGEDGV